MDVSCPQVDEEGNVWATSRGGVHVYTPVGEEIGFIRTGVKTGNVAFSKTHVYVCANDQVLRVPRRTTQ
jgi:gluconolactonase